MLYTQNDLIKAQNRAQLLSDSLDRGLLVLTPLENALLVANGGKLPDPLPPGEYAEKLELWRGLLLRYQQACDLGKNIKAALKAQAEREGQAA